MVPKAVDFLPADHIGRRAGHLRWRCHMPCVIEKLMLLPACCWLKSHMRFLANG